MLALLSLPNFWLTTAAGTIIGAAIGSFINVLAYRYPRMVKNLMTHLMFEESSYLVPPEEKEFFETEVFQDSRKNYGISFPASHCDGCVRPLRWFENIPLVSWIVLRGKCRTCGCSIPARVFFVELICSVYCGSVVWLFGITPFSLMACTVFFLLLALALIDMDCFMLPDELVYLLLWSGMAFSAIGLLDGYGVTVGSSIFNAIFMYALFWILSHILPGRLGGGDVKLFSAVSVFLTFENAVYLMILSSALGICWVIGKVICHGIKAMASPFPFGSSICFAGLGMFWWQVLA